MIKSLGSIAWTTLIIFLSVIFIFFFFKFLPIIIVIGIAAYIIYKAIGVFKRWKGSRGFNNVSQEEIQPDFRDEYDFSNKQIIDVEYYDTDK